MATAGSSTAMETSNESSGGRGNITIDKQYLGKVYATVREGMEKASQAFSLSIDYNCNIIGSLVLTLLWKPDQKYDTKYYLLKINGEKFDKILWVPEWTTLKEWAETKKLELDSKKLHPILFNIQMAAKTTEELLYHKNTVSKELGLPAWSEILASGKSIANKLKKSRNLSVGPLVHVQGLKKLFNLTASEKSKLKDDAQNQIKKRHIDSLKKQCISDTQRGIVEEFSKGDFSNLHILVASMASIKPHIEHHYALPPMIIAQIKNFANADMTTSWCYGAIATALSTLIKACPLEWQDAHDQLLVHSVFGTWKENLHVVEWAFGRTFDERSKWQSPKNAKKIENFVISKYRFSAANFSKPQRGAPRNIGPAHAQQLFNVVTMRGKRRAIDHFNDLDSMVKRMKPSGSNLMEKLQSEFLQYQSLETEGTGEWFKFMPDGSLGNEVTCPIDTAKYFFGTPSMDKK